jgi:NADH/NAD ratio-sensing transcriptional regulator Rex
MKEKIPTKLSKKVIAYYKYLERLIKEYEKINKQNGLQVAQEII